MTPIPIRKHISFLSTHLERISIIFSPENRTDISQREQEEKNLSTTMRK